MGGASASIKHPFGEVGQRGRIKFKINAVGETVFMDVCTILRSISPAENGGSCKHGYEFVELSTHDRLVLSAYFHQAGSNAISMPYGRNISYDVRRMLSQAVAPPLAAIIAMPVHAQKSGAWLKNIQLIKAAKPICA